MIRPATLRYWMRPAVRSERSARGGTPIMRAASTS
jgi:hypothetical protein